MDQQKMGNYLKQLRKNKELTQEQLAEHFYVSSRTVSRWETGSNMPDLETLINLADFYNVDIREIIDGERKSERMEDETKDTLKKVAEYAEKDKRIQMKIRMKRLLIGLMVLLTCMILFQGEYKGLLNGTIPESICSGIMRIAIIVQMSLCIESALCAFGAYEKMKRWRNNRKD